MLVTINTDASWDPQLKIGAYAFWIVSDGFRVKQAGVFKNSCINPHDAEAKCILNALHALATKEGYISRVIINTDSTNAIAILTGDKEHIQKYLGKKNNKQYNHLRSKYRKLKKNVNGMFRVEFRHVKAHSGKDDKRSFVNEWCDKTAKSFLRLERAKINKT